MRKMKKRFFEMGKKGFLNPYGAYVASMWKNVSYFYQ